MITIEEIKLYSIVGGGLLIGVVVVIANCSWISDILVMIEKFLKGDKHIHE